MYMDERMHLDYFCDEPVWGPVFFQRRFCMRRSLFLTILERVGVRDPYFVKKERYLRFSRVLFSSEDYGSPPDALSGCFS